MNITKYKLYIKYIVGILAILAAGILYCVRQQKAKSSDLQQWNSIEQETSEAGKDAFLDSDIKEADNLDKQKHIYVYVCGEVESSGVIECVEGTRIYEVVDMCGGYKESADLKAVNLAEEVKDGDKIYIPSENESYAESVADTKQQLININKASKEQLVTLPGIGESRAADIIKYRQEYGSFKSIEDIKNVSGIKDAAYNKIKDYICV